MEIFSIIFLKFINLTKLRCYIQKDMDIKVQHINLGYVGEIAGGDAAFKKELIQIFLDQIPTFISNMDGFLRMSDLLELAKEAHTAKSSVLIFGMEETGKLLKQIQLHAEDEEVNLIEPLFAAVKADLSEAANELNEVLKKL